ncbi:hypothetical protein DPMN_086541 [Dreissena polymorpha]|uniref:Uncharacterized protein n=1 Tax=Dreissena polymorpha TaxID=45954 RepID=A0A9D4KRE0_DREPO|nr:hypothetical protein DPMN_086541 [Dreissena polymorpha]
MHTIHSTTERQCTPYTAQQRDDAHHTQHNREMMHTIHGTTERRCTPYTAQQRDDAHHT